MHLHLHEKVSDAGKCNLEESAEDSEGSKKWHDGKPKPEDEVDLVNDDVKSQNAHSVKSWKLNIWKKGALKYCYLT